MAPLPLSHDEPATDDSVDTRITRPAGRWWLSLATAAGWGAAGGVAGGAGWALGLVAARVHLGIDLLDLLRHRDVAMATTLMAGVGVVVGILGGAAVALLLGGFDRADETVVPGALIGGAFGAVGGGLTPRLLAATGAWLAPEASSMMALALAGFLAGLAGYGWGRTRDTRRPSSRLLTVLGVAVACLAVAIATLASDAGWAVLVVGLLGLAVAWALSDQERRLRDLEQQLRERRDSSQHVRE